MIWNEDSKRIKEPYSKTCTTL